jgi:hypothetical protein
MSILIMAGADLRTDVWIVGVGLAGGLAIEGWGTQTHIWNYFTLERPPLWIIPAWPIASLSIDRLMRLLARLSPRERGRNYTIVYGVLFAGFYALMLQFVWPTRGMSLTLARWPSVPHHSRPRPALQPYPFAAVPGWATSSSCGARRGVLLLHPGDAAALAVLAHGMAAVIFWRAGVLARQLLARVRLPPRFGTGTFCESAACLSAGRENAENRWRGY